jgi:hypothetical protein
VLAASEVVFLLDVDNTLLFSCEQSLAAAEAYLRWIERRMETRA